MFRIRRFGIIRTANMAAFMYVVIIAVIFIPIALLVAAAGGNFGNTPGISNPVGGNAAGIAVIFIGVLAAVFYGIVGWIVTAIACALYNFAAGVIGGIEIQLEAVQPPPPPVVWGTPSAPPTTPSYPSGSEPPSAVPPAG
jgi:hypothetical protein